MPQQKWQQQKFRGFQCRAVQLTEKKKKDFKSVCARSRQCAWKWSIYFFL